MVQKQTCCLGARWSDQSVLRRQRWPLYWCGNNNRRPIADDWCWSHSLPSSIKLSLIAKGEISKIHLNTLISTWAHPSISTFLQVLHFGPVSQSLTPVTFQKVLASYPGIWCRLDHLADFKTTRPASIWCHKHRPACGLYGPLSIWPTVYMAQYLYDPLVQYTSTQQAESASPNSMFSH